MRLTTARYYTPSGRSIQAQGIEPDIFVEPAKIEQLNIRRYRESDLRGALVNEDAEATDDPVVILTPEPSKDDTESKTKDGDKEKDEDKAIEDYQLSRAIDLIRGVSLYEMRLKEMQEE